MHPYINSDHCLGKNQEDSPNRIKETLHGHPLDKPKLKTSYEYKK